MTKTQIDKIIMMYNTGHNMTQISNVIGVCRHTVSRILGGKNRRGCKKTLRPTFNNKSIPVRCSGCGAKVFLPCLRCKLK